MKCLSPTTAALFLQRDSFVRFWQTQIQYVGLFLSLQLDCITVFPQRNRVYRLIGRLASSTVRQQKDANFRFIRRSNSAYHHHFSLLRSHSHTNVFPPSVGVLYCYESYRNLKKQTKKKQELCRRRFCLCCWSFLKLLKGTICRIWWLLFINKPI